MSLSKTAIPILPIAAPVGKPDSSSDIKLQLAPPSILLYIPELYPSSSKFQDFLSFSQDVAYIILKSPGVSDISIIPLTSFIYNVLFQFFPPSFVTYTPLFIFFEYKCPVTPITT